jgi:hypothetical protein
MFMDYLNKNGLMNVYEINDPMFISNDSQLELL